MKITNSLRNGKNLALFMRAFFIIAILFMLSGCCQKNLSVQDGHDAVSYYVCTSCGAPCDRVICIPLAYEGNEDDDN